MKMPDGCTFNNGLIERVKRTPNKDGKYCYPELFVFTIESVLGHKVETFNGYVVNKLKKPENIRDRYGIYKRGLCICGHAIHNQHILITTEEPVNYGFIVGCDCVLFHANIRITGKEKELLLLSDIYHIKNVSNIHHKQEMFKNRYDSKLNFEKFQKRKTILLNMILKKVIQEKMQDQKHAFQMIKENYLYLKQKEDNHLIQCRKSDNIKKNIKMRIQRETFVPLLRQKLSIKK